LYWRSGSASFPLFSCRAYGVDTADTDGEDDQHGPVPLYGLFVERLSKASCFIFKTMPGPEGWGGDTGCVERR